MKEGRNLEFKQDISNTFLKTVSAFANFGDGVILFGVSYGGDAVGVKDPDAGCLDIENRINDSISPRPDYTMSINRRTGVITLRVSQGRNKPYMYNGKAYRRSDTATVEADPLELRRLVLEGSNMYFEDLPCGSDDLTFEYFETRLKEKLGIRSLNEDILRTFGLYSEDKKYNIAAALFSDRNSFSGVDIARFGSSLNEILDRETAAGVSILKQYDAAVSLYRRYYQYEKIEGIERKTVETVPEEAFREAVANALVHRTWDISSNVRIAMFPDRIEITSPGGLPAGITKEEYLNGYISNLRNPVIANVFFRLHYIEMFGTGVRRIKESYKSAYIGPEFTVSDNAVKVVLPCMDSRPKLTSDGRTLLNAMDSEIMMSSSELAETLGWTRDKTIRTLNMVFESGAVVKYGTGRGTRYFRR